MTRLASSSRAALGSRRANVPVTSPACHEVRVLLNGRDAWSERVLAGIGEFAHDQQSWFLDVRRDSDASDDVRGIDAVIACDLNPQQLDRYREAGVPVVLVTSKRLHADRFPTVVIDEQACGELAATHFMDRKYAHFAYLGDASLRREGDELVTGYLRGLSDADHPCERLALPADQSLKQKIATVCSWVRQLPKPVAVLGYDANHAQLLVEACRRLRIRIPESVGILSGDDDVLAGSITTVGVSGIDRGFAKAGREAGRILAQLLQEKVGAPSTVMVKPGGVIERESTDTVAVDDPEVAWAIRYIREHIGEPIQVTDVVAAVGMSRRALEKRFLHSLGRTPGQEIRRWRLKKVQKLLVETNLPIQDVATAAGFVYAEVMQRTFKRYIKMVPSDYRRLHQRAPRV